VPPHRAKRRRCRPPQLAFLASRGEELERPGLVEQTTNSRRASAPHSVPTSNAEGDRLTVDLRQVHQRTDPIVWTVSDRESCAHRLAASACYASADISKCYWQLALDEDSQEGQSSVAPDGVYTPRRVLHGQVGATACAQAAVRIMFQDLADKLLSWLDDLLLHGRDVDDLPQVLETFLNRCAARGVKLGAGKMDRRSQEVRWCGRVVSRTESASTRALCLPWRPCNRR
jgi:Reverse transcriptase (RNA-dependent DNA polymerase)